MNSFPSSEIKSADLRAVAPGTTTLLEQRHCWNNDTELIIGTNGTTFRQDSQEMQQQANLSIDYVTNINRQPSTGFARKMRFTESVTCSIDGMRGVVY